MLSYADTETGEITGTKDKDYTLIWVTERSRAVQGAPAQPARELTRVAPSRGRPPRGALGAFVVEGAVAPEGRGRVAVMS
jgi:hypothetical protein